jgi:hypothetical protein
MQFVPPQSSKVPLHPQQEELLQFWQLIENFFFDGLQLGMDSTVTMGEEPEGGTPEGDAQNQQLMTNQKRWEDNEGETRPGNDGASRYASANDYLERRICKAGRTEKKHQDSNPHNSLESPELGSHLSRGVLLGRPDFGVDLFGHHFIISIRYPLVILHGFILGVLGLPNGEHLSGVRGNRRTPGSEGDRGASGEGRDY